MLYINIDNWCMMLLSYNRIYMIIDKMFWVLLRMIPAPHTYTTSPLLFFYSMTNSFSFPFHFSFLPSCFPPFVCFCLLKKGSLQLLTELVLPIQLRMTLNFNPPTPPFWCCFYNHILCLTYVVLRITQGFVKYAPIEPYIAPVPCRYAF